MRPPCATPGGRAAHKRHNEPICAPCADAHSDYIRSNRIHNGTSSYVQIPAAVLRLVLPHVPADTLAVCRRELGVRTVAALLKPAQPQQDQPAGER